MLGSTALGDNMLAGDAGRSLADGVVLTKSSGVLLQMLRAQGGVARQAPERLARIRYSSSGQLLCCQSAGKLVELFR